MSQLEKLAIQEATQGVAKSRMAIELMEQQFHSFITGLSEKSISVSQIDYLREQKQILKDTVSDLRKSETWLAAIISGNE